MRMGNAVREREPRADLPTEAPKPEDDPAWVTAHAETVEKNRQLNALTARRAEVEPLTRNHDALIRLDARREMKNLDAMIERAEAEALRAQEAERAVHLQLMQGVRAYYFARRQAQTREYDAWLTRGEGLTAAMIADEIAARAAGVISLPRPWWPGLAGRHNSDAARWRQQMRAERLLD